MQGGAAVDTLGGVAAAAAADARARKVTPRLDVEPGVAEAALARWAPDDGRPLRSPAKGDEKLQGLPALDARAAGAVTAKGEAAGAGAGDGAGDGNVAGDSATNGGEGLGLFR